MWDCSLLSPANMSRTRSSRGKKGGKKGGRQEIKVQKGGKDGRKQARRKNE
jgi:hypothetical protein